LRERGRERGAVDLALLLSPAGGREAGREGPLLLLYSSLPLAGERPGERGCFALLLSPAGGREAGREGLLLLLCSSRPLAGERPGERGC